MECRIVVELDGGQHIDAGNYDAERDAEMKRRGWRVVRFWDDDVLCRTELVLEALWQELHAADSPAG